MRCFFSRLSADRNSKVVTAFLCCCSTAAMVHSPSLQTRHDSSRLTVDGRSAAFIWTHSSILQNSYLHLSIFRSAVAALWWCRREPVKSVCINQVLVSTSTFNKRVWCWVTDLLPDSGNIKSGFSVFKVHMKKFISRRELRLKLVINDEVLMASGWI